MFHSRNRRASVPPPPSSSSLDSDELDELDDPEDDPSSAAWLRRSRLTPRAGDAEVSSACPLIPEGHVHPPSLSGCAHTSSRHARHHARLVSSPGASSGHRATARAKTYRQPHRSSSARRLSDSHRFSPNARRACARHAASASSTRAPVPQDARARGRAGGRPMAGSGRRGEISDVRRSGSDGSARVRWASSDDDDDDDARLPSELPRPLHGGGLVRALERRAFWAGGRRVRRRGPVARRASISRSSPETASPRATRPRAPREPRASALATPLETNASSSAARA